MSAMFTKGRATTYHERWITADYIFYTKFKRKPLIKSEQAKYSCLQLLKVFEAPTISECTQIGPMPNQYFGSDHYPIAAEFVIMFYR